jgi:peptide/nickel transport system substrate-binding protein
MATGWKFLKHNKVLDVYIRPHMVFSNGDPVTAADVAWNFTQDTNPANACSCIALLADVSSAVAISKYTVQFNFSTPYTPILSVFENSGPAYIIDPAVYEADGGPAYIYHPVGAGPYMVQSDGGPNTSITLVKNPHYWDAKHVYLNSIVYTYDLVDSSAYATLASGAAQLAVEVNPDPGTLGQAKSNPQVHVTAFPATGLSFIALNTNIAPFNNPIAREAFADAIDPGPIAKTVYSGIYTAGPTIFGSGVADRPSPSMVKGWPEYNPTKAKALVQQLGGLSFSFVLQGNGALQVAAGEAMEQQLVAAGMNVTLKAEPTFGAFAALLNGGNFQAVQNNNNAYTDAGLWASFFYYSGSAFNHAFESPTVDALLNKANGTTVKATRVKYLAEISSYVVQQHYIVPLYTNSVDYIVSNQLHGVTGFGSGGSPILYYQRLWLS